MKISREAILFGAFAIAGLLIVYFAVARGRGRAPAGAKGAVGDGAPLLPWGAFDDDAQADAVEAARLDARRTLAAWEAEALG